MFFVSRNRAALPARALVTTNRSSAHVSRRGHSVVETSGCGFLPDRRPRILFGRHWFSKLTKRQFDASHPDISNPVAGGYGPRGASQYQRLERAIALDRVAALRSATGGLGQVVGFNVEDVGFANVDALVAAGVESEEKSVCYLT